MYGSVCIDVRPASSTRRRLYLPKLRPRLRLLSALSVDEAPNSHPSTTDGATGGGVSRIQTQLAGEQLESTRTHQLIVGVSFGLNFWILSRALFSIENWPGALGASLAFYGGYCLADLLSGIYHWSIDNYGSKDTPFVGKQIDGFQRHHLYPWTITYRQLCNNLHTVCLPALPFSAVLLLTHPSFPVEIFGSVGCMCVVLSQQFHSWAHTKKSDLPSWVQFLQDRGVLVSTKMHCQHHRPPFNKNYCIVSGLWNPFLDRYGIFYKMESLVHEKTGVAARSWQLPSTEDAVEYFMR